MAQRGTEQLINDTIAYEQCVFHMIFGHGGFCYERQIASFQRKVNPDCSLVYSGKQKSGNTETVIAHRSSMENEAIFEAKRVRLESE